MLVHTRKTSTSTAVETKKGGVRRDVERGIPGLKTSCSLQRSHATAPIAERGTIACTIITNTSGTLPSLTLH